MRIRLSIVAVITLQLICCVSATSRAFQQGNSPMISPDTMEAKMVSEEAYRGMSTIGSRPPNCQHKCGGCVPCEAIQVPTSNDQLRVQYANYEPEGWKCKCGSSFFSP